MRRLPSASIADPGTNRAGMNPHIWPRDIERLDAVNRGSLPCRRSVRHPGTEFGALGLARVDQLLPIRGLQTHPQPPVPLRVVAGDPVVPGAASLDVEGRPPPIRHPRQTVEPIGAEGITLFNQARSPRFLRPRRRVRSSSPYPH
jgi:hypothetical protein